MSMFLQSNDSQSVGSRVMKTSYAYALTCTVYSGNWTSAIVTGKDSRVREFCKDTSDHSRPDGKEKSTLGKRIGQTIGTVADTKDRMVDTASGLKEQVKDLPTNARYAVYQGKSKVKENVRDLTSSISQTKADRASGRKEQQEQRRKPLRSVALKWNRSNRKNSLLLLFMKDRLQDKNNIMMNRPQNSLIFRLHIRNLNKPNKSVQQLSPIFQVKSGTPRQYRSRKTVQKPATSTTTADRTSQRPITKERPSTVQRVPLQNTRSRPPIKTATIKKVGKKP